MDCDCPKCESKKVNWPALLAAMCVVLFCTGVASLLWLMIRP